jgi:hypothetical protein
MSTGSLGSSTITVATTASANGSTQSLRPSQQASITDPLAEIKHNWLIKNVQHSRDGDEYTSELFPCTNCSTR